MIFLLKERSSSVWDDQLRIDISLAFPFFYLFLYSGVGRFLIIKFYILWVHNISYAFELCFVILLDRIYYEGSSKRIIFQLFM